MTKMHPSPTSERGFTLIEVLISIGVMSLISGIIITIFLAISSAYDKASVVSSVNQDGSRIMEQVVRAIRNGTEAVETFSPVGITLTVPRTSGNLEYSSNGGCTTVNLYFDDTTDSLKKSASSCDGTAVCSTASPCTLTSADVTVSSATFSVIANDDGPDQVHVDFVLRQKPSLSDPEQQASQEFERTVSTRGY